MDREVFDMYLFACRTCERFGRLGHKCDAKECGAPYLFADRKGPNLQKHCYVCGGIGSVILSDETHISVCTEHANSGRVLSQIST